MSKTYFKIKTKKRNNNDKTSEKRPSTNDIVPVPDSILADLEETNLDIGNFDNSAGSELNFFRCQNFDKNTIFSVNIFYTEKRLLVSMLPVSVLKFTIKITKKGLCILLTTPCFLNLNLQLYQG